MNIPPEALEGRIYPVVEYFMQLILNAESPEQAAREAANLFEKVKWKQNYQLANIALTLFLSVKNEKTPPRVLNSAAALKKFKSLAEPIWNLQTKADTETPETARLRQLFGKDLPAVKEVVEAEGRDSNTSHDTASLNAET